MKDREYQELHELPKKLDDPDISVAAPGTQAEFPGHGQFNKRKTFIVIQNRKGHHRKNNLTYVLRSNLGVMIRIDINGTMHHKVPTPHVHIFDEAHNNGTEVIPLAKLANYTNISDDIIESLKAFLKYNNFEMEGLNISPILL